MRQKLLVLGTTPYTEVFIDSFEAVEGIAFAGCVENRDQSRCGQTLAGLLIHWTDDIDELRTTHQLTCSLATTARAEWIRQMTARGFAFATLAHPA